MIIYTHEELAREIDYFLTQDAFCFDVETLASPNNDHRGNPRRNRVHWIGMATHGRTISIPLGFANGDYLRTEFPLTPTGQKWVDEGKVPKAMHYSKDKRKGVRVFSDPPPHLRFDAEVKEILRPLFFSDRLKVNANIKFDIESLAKHFGGDLIPGPYADTMIAGFVLDMRNKGRLDLASCAEREVGYHMTKGVGADISKQSFQDVAKYSYLDAKYTWLTWLSQSAQVSDPAFANLFRLEMDVLDVVISMEHTGATVDTAVLEHLAEEFGETKADLEEVIYRLSGGAWNIGSNAERQRLLFAPKAEGGLGLRTTVLTPGGKARKQRGEELTIKDYAVSDIALRKHESKPLVGSLLEWESVDKLLGSFITPYIGGEVTRTSGGKSKTETRETLLVNGRIHARFNQVGTDTGRFCVDPETLVEMPRDLSTHPDGIPLKDVKEGDWVYSFTWEKRLVLRQVKWCGPTKVADTVVVTIRDKYGKVTKLTCTPDHLIRKWDGDWSPAGALKPDDRLMGMLQRRYSDSGHAYFPPSIKRALPGKTTGGKVYEHRWVHTVAGGKRPAAESVVHHIDHNELNNHWSNLRTMNRSEHSSYHRGMSRENIQAMLDGAPLTCHKKSLRRAAKKYGLSPTNHTVVSVEPGPEQMQLWDMEVDETHTFIGADVAIHNSSSEPNLTQVPSRSVEGKRIRAAFIAPAGEKLVVADFSQIEPRIIADLSGSKALISTYLDGGDIYMTLAEPFGLQRPEGKTLVLAVSYGVGADKIAGSLGMTVKEAKKLIYEDFPKRFPEIDQLKKRVIKESRARRPVYVQTLLGRRRYMPELWSTDQYLRSRAERQCFNALIQGSAADIQKIAMVRTHRSINPECHLILTVHDEIVVTAPAHLAEETASVLKESMEGATLLKTVPLIAEVKIADNWAEGK